MKNLQMALSILEEIQGRFNLYNELRQHNISRYKYFLRKSDLVNEAIKNFSDGKDCLTSKYRDSLSRINFAYLYKRIYYLVLDVDTDISEQYNDLSLWDKESIKARVLCLKYIFKCA